MPHAEKFKGFQRTVRPLPSLPNGIYYMEGWRKRGRTLELHIQLNREAIIRIARYFGIARAH